MFNPQPKPTKKQKEVISANDFKKQYGTKKISTKSKKKSNNSQHYRFYSSNAWRWFRRYIISLYADPETMTVPNFTGWKPLPMKGKETHVGHYIKVFEGSNSRMSIAFDERNVLPQSGQDNRYHGGKQDRMGEKIILIHGEGTAHDLLQKSREVCILRQSHFDDIAHIYKKKTEDICAEKGLGKWWK